ncbi:MAG: prolipoprotein diacylglyceryl transferase [Elusimicrobia bacterium]|nr:prolipoprotein diacylglyceryl transferase [Elusimicrobiota bacterium]
MFPRILSIGPVTLYSYGLMVFIAVMAAWFVLKKETVGRIDARRLEDIAFFSLLWGFIAARFFHFVFWNSGALLVNPLDFFYVWRGGLAVGGGIIGGFLALVYFSRKEKIAFAEFCDYFAAPMILGQAIGRIGCFLAGCCYGSSCEHFPGVTFTNSASLAPVGVSIHPVQLYESFLNFALFFIIMKTPLKKKGLRTAFYLAGYGMIRFFMEFIRGDTVSGFWGLTIMQIIAIIFVVSAGVYLFAVFQKTENEKRI